MAIAAGVAAAASVAAAGVAAASQAGAFGGGGTPKPQVEQVPKRPFEQASQKYLTRVLASNINTRGPTYQEWLQSGGKAAFQWQNAGMTPREAEHMGVVGPGGRPQAWVDPSVAAQSGLTPGQYISGGIGSGPKQQDIEARIGRVQKRIDRLTGMQQAGVDLRPGQEARLGRLQERQKRLMAKGYHGGSGQQE